MTDVSDTAIHDSPPPIARYRSCSATVSVQLFIPELFVVWHSARFLVQACGTLALLLWPLQHFAHTFAYFLFLDTAKNGVSALPGVTVTTFFFSLFKYRLVSSLATTSYVIKKLTLGC